MLIRVCIFIFIAAPFFVLQASAQDAGIDKSSIICTEASPEEIYTRHFEGDVVDLCQVTGTSIDIYVLRTGLSRLTSGSMLVALGGAANWRDGSSRAEAIVLRQVLPRVWDVTHFLEDETPIGIGETQLIWFADIHHPDIRRDFASLSFGAYRVFRCNGNPTVEFPNSVDSCITFYRVSACDHMPLSPDGQPALSRYIVVTVRARTREDAVLMLRNYTLLHRIAAEYAQEIQNLNCGYGNDDTAS